MFFGAKAGDVQPDWIDTSKIAIPQADEQQRLLANLITLMERDRMPVPRFWYLPRGEKAVVLLSGDDHSPSYAPGGTAEPFRPLQGAERAGLRRRRLGMRTRNLLPLRRQPAHERAGCRLSRRRLRDRAAPSLRVLSADCDLAGGARSRFRRAARRVPGQVHEPAGAGYQPHPLRLLARLGVGGEGRARARDPAGCQLLPLPRKLDRGTPGFMNGGGFPMRFADLDGTPIDVYQQNTNLTDESTSDVRRGNCSAARQRARPAGLLRRIRHEHPHRRPRSLAGV